MNFIFALVSAVTLVAAGAAMMLPNLVHCALCAAVAFGGVGVLFMLMGSAFLGLAQLLVYVGAVAMLVVFAILLTGGGVSTSKPRVRGAGGAAVGAAAVVMLGVCLLFGVASPAGVGGAGAGPAGSASVKAIGLELMGTYLVPLEALALLLTAAMVGAVVVAIKDPAGRKGGEHD